MNLRAPNTRTPNALFYALSDAEKQAVLYATHIRKTNSKRIYLYPRTSSENSLVNRLSRLTLEVVLDKHPHQWIENGVRRARPGGGFKTWKEWHTHLRAVAEKRGYRIIEIDPNEEAA